MKNEYFLILLILTFRMADGVTSYIPAKGMIEGVGEGNPIALSAIGRWGFFWGFVIMTAISLGFALAFVATTYLEEARRAGSIDQSGILRIRRFRIAGLILLAVLSSLPVFTNLAVALSLN